ncbi:uncharacterized protein F4807DRAFT_148957 [Annulohypoxylon truncatum]|uniref:uncharacterized protein n=1 Tax=Annulohypoxylon truncatum TaxID=327061 RepID=UPI00200796AE|nr:uncharacterized protein F4807DRAFT_148957 [Annulohypoxylon truncatum]KAI1208356.1 hypothetical protein F4807DRAFT_148957 [Annulohypoxylon truncatum]
MNSYEKSVQEHEAELNDHNADGDAKIRKLSIETLDSQHSDLFVRALDRVISTDLAKLTYAQIVDGLPLIDTVNDNMAGGLSNGHPLYDMHESLCDGVMERTEEIRATFDPKELKFDSRLIYAYQSASPGSQVFRMRLIEIIAIAVHQIAAILFKRDTSLHKNDGITEWVPPKEDIVFWQFLPNGPLPTLFHHPCYTDYDQYPDGVADMVGYWAESRIIGGVVLFDRGTPDRKPDTDAVFLHPDREEVTYRIYRLLESQKKQLLDFLLSDTPGPSPFPILASMENTHRVDPEDDIDETGVYRDIWERKPLPPDCPDGRLHCVWDPFNFPSWDEWQEAKWRCRERRSRPYY